MSFTFTIKSQKCRFPPPNEYLYLFGTNTNPNPTYLLTLTLPGGNVKKDHM